MKISISFDPASPERDQATATSTRLTLTASAMDFDRVYELLNSEQDARKLGPLFARVDAHWMNILNPSATMNFYGERIKKRQARSLSELAQRNSPMYQIALILLADLVGPSKDHERLSLLDPGRFSGEDRKRLEALSWVFETFQIYAFSLFLALESLAMDEVRTNRKEVELECMRIRAWASIFSAASQVLDMSKQTEILRQATDSNPLGRNLRGGAFPYGRMHNKRAKNPWEVKHPKRFKLA